MSGAVDVRAVLEDAVPVYGSRFSHADFDIARVAVPELIEASAALCGAIEFRIDDPRNALRDRVVKALAIVGPAA